MTCRSSYIVILLKLYILLLLNLVYLKKLYKAQSGFFWMKFFLMFLALHDKLNIS